ncbi:MAG: hypothetical protein L6Q34_13410 [Nitrospira sp.]|nr:hypothetical protein [Nitrospira sp.]RIK58978.1 MAG: hypothetical protein DCC63_08545 [Nitrospira sp.]
MSADSLSDGLTETDPTRLEQLTQDAVDAARAGKWDRVEVCYAQREILLVGCRVGRDLARRLCEMDEQVRSTLLVAQAGIMSLLADSAQFRRRLRNLRQMDQTSVLMNGVLHVKG